MTMQRGDQLDTAYEALRAWCHERPDLQDPSSAYRAFGTITAMIPTLEHIVQLVSHAAARSTASDDGRTVAAACDLADAHAQVAVGALEEARRAVAEAHQVVGHLIFAVRDEDADARSAAE